MDDEQAISNLISRLQLHRDLGQWDEAARILDGAAFETHYPAAYPGYGNAPEEVVNRPPGSTGRRHGAEEIAAMFRSTARLYEDGRPHTQYVTTNLIIDVDPDRTTATAHSYYMVLQSRPDFPLQPISAGRYLDRFAKVDGEWRFTARDVYADHSGDLSHHLSKDPIAYGDEVPAADQSAAGDRPGD
jgi:hypothetical protein